ncbi:hypothetical protein KEJ47_09520 [Candidatus Bathyarchaeota archaeon]|nr:hypothetical protein [Candidatus Bathyarchaeota archaeon]
MGLRGYWWIISALLVIIISSTGFLLYLSNDLEQESPLSEGYTPPSLMDLGFAISFDEAKTNLNKIGFNLYLPSNLPDNLTPTVAWTTSTQRASYVFVFSKSGSRNLETAELIMELIPSSSLIFYREKETDILTEINGWEVFMCEDAYVGFKEYATKYGTQYAKLICVRIGSLNYLFRAEPSITMNELIDVVKSMKLAS